MIDTRVLCETLMSINVQEDVAGAVTKEDSVSHEQTNVGSVKKWGTKS